MQALAGVALLELGQVQAGAEMFAFAVEHGGSHRIGKRFEDIAYGQDQAVAERVALGRTAQPDDGDGVPDLEMDVFVAHEAFAKWVDYGYK